MGYFLYFILFSILFGSARCICYKSTESGSYKIGATECVLFSLSYTKHQWATCLTDTYIDTFSEGFHTCRNTSLTCWYQCMLEVHHQEQGEVYDDCACTPDAPRNVTTQPTVVTSSIPDWCFSPTGSDCSWYKDCLEKRYPCQDEDNSDAMDYAENFCNLYHDHHRKFYTMVQQWIDAVRKCLQVKLVPILRPFVKANCESIKQTALDSYSGCYLHPDEGKPSICTIDLLNLMRIFWTVKGTLVQDATAILKQMLDVVSSSCDLDILPIGNEKIQMKFQIAKDTAMEKLDKFAENIADQIASKMGWYRKGVLYFGFPTSVKSNDNIPAVNLVYINLLIAPKSKFDLNTEDAHETNVSAEAISVAKGIENGYVRLET
ncbi:uncharacterized protein LOC132719395 [Ruditapes philippinarum]|uniref:uncharacterized protein LOC132719395 n=1 Tax=Ruditapes philippinarum TaxID=129788 RepID=UPI00295AF21D|nr:uncharacterized protein LOC132719395 [Ruditapes philippinarum]